MDEEILQGGIGNAGKYDLAFKGGQLQGEADVSFSHKAGPLTLTGTGKVVVALSAGDVLDALAAAIPGKFDDAVIAEAKLLLGIPVA